MFGTYLKCKAITTTQDTSSAVTTCRQPDLEANYTTNYSELHSLYATTMSSRDRCEWWSYQVLERHESLKATYVNLENRGTGTFPVIE